jgi:glyoxylase-like metal-dependent hydrolase (beta-lactamase superfamily II)
VSETYELLAIRYAQSARQSPENFIGGDLHDLPMPLDYFVWVIRNEARTIVVDTGFGEEQARERGRDLLHPVAEGLAAAGVDPAAVRDVVITHMHYDHAGNNELFPDACFHLQDREMAFATGRCMCHAHANHPYNVEDVVGLVRRVYAGAVRFHDGVAELAPGVTLHRVGGHSRGLQCVRVMTGRGPVVLASDTTHFYRHIEEGRVFPTCDSVSDTLLGYDLLRGLGKMTHIVPGHDPEVMARYPAESERTKGWIARLDRDPRGAQI